MNTPQAFYSLEDVARRLGLQVRTVRSYVRSGRLKAVRIGKQYRVTRADLDALVGTTTQTQTPVLSARADASSIVQIDGIDFDAASRLGTGLMAALKGARDGDAAMRVETIYDKDNARLKVILSGSPDTTARLLRIISVYLEQ